ncbi:MAG TPA: hypothetical protein ACFCUY_10315 [Xenococcaceae cyanobacterium]|jgi:hemerythrin-like domain-containing protein
MEWQATETGQQQAHEDIRDYVAQLQLHMALQARNLLPTLTTNVSDSRQQMLQETQAVSEKWVSRQYKL